MLSIYSLNNSPRLQYTAKILFEIILGVQYEITRISEGTDIQNSVNDEKQILIYGFALPDQISIPNDGLLFESDMRKQEVHFRNDGIPELFFTPHKHIGYTIDFDIFSSLFYLVTQYELYHSISFDQHGRYIEHSDSDQLQNLQKLPVAELYAEYIWQILISKYPQLKRRENKFDFRVSFDIDSPYLFIHKGLLLTAASLIRKIISFKIRNLSDHVKAIISNKDPYDVYDKILKSVQSDKLLFFFLINRKNPNDGRHTFKNKAYQALMQKISGPGISVGIHPSYSSYLDKDLIKAEKSKLENIINKSVFSSRMHFLKYRLPETFENLISAGITHDYTVCPIHHTGFKTYMMRPYPWFDLIQNTETDLILHPTMVMDRTLQQYMHLSPAEALEEIKSIIDICYYYQGEFTILFHNNSLSETDEWKGWKMVFENTIMYLSGKN